MMQSQYIRIQNSTEVKLAFSLTLLFLNLNKKFLSMSQQNGNVNWSNNKFYLTQKTKCEEHFYDQNIMHAITFVWTILNYTCFCSHNDLLTTKRNSILHCWQACIRNKDRITTNGMKGAIFLLSSKLLFTLGYCHKLYKIKCFTV